MSRKTPDGNGARRGPVGVVTGKDLLRLPLESPGKSGSWNGPYREPQTDTERGLQQIWQSLLRTEPISTNAGFIDLGGTSLTATMMVARIYRAFGVDLHLGDVLDNPTIEQLARLIANQPSAPVEPIPKLPRGGRLPLSLMQERVWLLHQMAPHSPAYNISGAVRLRGSLDRQALREAIRLLSERHETLRTTFNHVEGIPRQVVHEGYRLGLREVDLEDRETEQELEARLTREAEQPFRLHELPLARFVLYRLAPDHHVLQLTIHHIVCDGWSIALVMRELDDAYTALAAGKTTALPPLSLQYADFALWHRERSQDKQLGRELDYWRRELGGDLPPLALPTDRSRPAVKTHRGKRLPFRLPGELTEPLKGLSRSEGATLFMTLLAVFETLLFRYTGQQTVVVGTPHANRNRSEVEPLIGFLVNTLVLRTRLAGDMSFRTLLREVKRVCLGAFENHLMPFEKLLEDIKPERTLSQSPLVQATFMLAPGPELRLGDLQVEMLGVDRGASLFDMSFEMWEDEAGLAGVVEFDSDLFQTQSVRRLVDHYRNLLEAAVGDADRTLEDLPLLGPEEREQLLVEWNRTDTPYPAETTVHELVSEQARRAPEAPAVRFDGRTLTYRQLEERAESFAARLRQLGAGPGALVGVSAERTPETVAALLGILKAGAAYLPLDPSYPRERLLYMLRDSGARLLVAQDTARRIFAGYEGTVVPLSEVEAGRESRGATGGAAGAAGEPTAGTPASAGPEDLAYLIYTSGSTGKPKGVEIPHRAVVNFLFAMQREPGLTAQDRLLSVTTLSFDISVLEIFLPLITGAQVVLADRRTASDGRLLARTLRESGATVMQATPAGWRLLLEAGWRNTEAVRMLCGGEPLATELAETLLATGGELWNMYGPTETTVWSSVRRVRQTDLTDGPVPIGAPIANTQFYVLDPNGQPVPFGVAGELYIGGDGLARGYRGAPELTAERFASHPLASGAAGQGRLYRTGDRVRYREDGSMEFLGRVDHQLKIRGFRIEPGEVEAVLRAHPAVGNAVVVAREAATDRKGLAAFLTSGDSDMQAGVERDGRPSEQELRRFLSERLPDYMVPATLTWLGQLPLTPSGKVDRKALGEMPLQRTDDSLNAPRGRVEKQMARLWERALGVSPIGAEQDFFALGGHSLLAARLAAQIEKTFGCRIPLSEFFRARTVREMSGWVRRCGPSAAASSLVPIRRSGSRPPLFLVHGAEGNVLLYRELARELGEDQPVYGLQAVGVTNPTVRIEDLAERYIEEICTVWPEGPYLLGGYCMGGVVAYEMARQLRERGDEVPLLVLLETYNVKAEDRPLPDLAPMIHLVQDVGYHLSNLLSIRTTETPGFLYHKARVGMRRIQALAAHVVSRLAAGLRGGGPSGQPTVTGVMHKSLDRYDPEPYPGNVVLFRPRTHFAWLQDPDFGWSELAGEGLETVRLPLSPRGMLVDPFVRTLARQLDRRIARCRKGVREAAG